MITRRDNEVKTKIQNNPFCRRSPRLRARQLWTVHRNGDFGNFSCIQKRSSISPLTLAKFFLNRVLLHASDMETASPRRRSRSFRAVQTVLGVAILLATLFTALPSRGLMAGGFYNRLSVILTPNTNVSPPLAASQPQLRIGIVAGHSGNDSGAVCTDGGGNVTLTEADVNLKIAAMVQEQLTQKGYQVDLFANSTHV